MVVLAHTDFVARRLFVLAILSIAGGGHASSDASGIADVYTSHQPASLVHDFGCANVANGGWDGPCCTRSSRTVVVFDGDADGAARGCGGGARVARGNCGG